MIQKELVDSAVLQHHLWLTDVSIGEQANFTNADLSNNYLRGADLSGAVFWNTKLAGMDLRDVTLKGAVMSNASLRGADLRWVDLSGSVLENADLSSADLRGADLRDTLLQGANLSDANLQYSAWPLCPESAHSNIKVDKHLAAQLLYHACIIAQQHLKIPKVIVKFVSDYYRDYSKQEKLED